MGGETHRRNKGWMSTHRKGAHSWTPKECVLCRMARHDKKQSKKMPQISNKKDLSIRIWYELSTIFTQYKVKRISLLCLGTSQPVYQPKNNSSTYQNCIIPIKLLPDTGAPPSPANGNHKMVVSVMKRTRWSGVAKQTKQLMHTLTMHILLPKILLLDLNLP